MESYIINGGKKINGSVKISSSKNSVLPMLAGAILTGEEVIINNCPKIYDVFSMIEILKELGAKVIWQEDNLVINSKDLNNFTISENLSKN